MVVLIIIISVITLLILTAFVVKKIYDAKLESEIDKIKIPDDTFDEKK